MACMCRACAVFGGWMGVGGCGCDGVSLLGGSYSHMCQKSDHCVRDFILGWGLSS